jgi:hypothetical protein
LFGVPARFRSHPSAQTGFQRRVAHVCRGPRALEPPSAQRWSSDNDVGLSERVVNSCQGPYLSAGYEFLSPAPHGAPERRRRYRGAVSEAAFVPSATYTSKQRFVPVGELFVAPRPGRATRPPHRRMRGRGMSGERPGRVAWRRAADRGIRGKTKRMRACSR